MHAYFNEIQNLFTANDIDANCKKQAIQTHNMKILNILKDI